MHINFRGIIRATFCTFISSMRIICEYQQWMVAKLSFHVLCAVIPTQRTAAHISHHFSPAKVDCYWFNFQARLIMVQSRLILLRQKKKKKNLPRNLGAGFTTKSSSFHDPMNFLNEYPSADIYTASTLPTITHHRYHCHLVSFMSDALYCSIHRIIKMHNCKCSFHPKQDGPRWTLKKSKSKSRPCCLSKSRRDYSNNHIQL